MVHLNKIAKDVEYFLSLYVTFANNVIIESLVIDLVVILLLDSVQNSFSSIWNIAFSVKLIIVLSSLTPIKSYKADSFSNNVVFPT